MFQDQLRLCLVTHAQSQPIPLYKEFIRRAIEGGVTMLQVRDKSKDSQQLYEMALELKALLEPYKIPLIINDHVDLALAIDAEGVHLGQSDISPLEARKRLGPDKIIGWSLESLQDLERAQKTPGIDYLAASAVFPSKTKVDCKTIWGLEGLSKLVQNSKHPIMAIGGIDQSNIQAVMASGACGVAVIGALHDHEDPRAAAAQLIEKINQSLNPLSRSVLYEGRG